ncbi:NAD-dependent epimerase/dehydratase family protein [Streptomyces buecherae]|uniref:GDP-mannose 4,6-dehydratase n=1 Tax=Streptomyces buecherae TaxID=2763006 RepID=A0A7H8NI89_9ACTN|nr:GDP-mannose 4,6-dehydratase [Streptomyces buecherae]QKW48228.1 GDP-mannose 4,6-dehydratase [Streptomyces buecherae]QKW54102.1 GDP-mannose 4,6-dehydratase [Streptomyces buecherae]
MDWNSHPVLVTGADGFIGSHLVDALLDRGALVTAVVRRTSRAQVTARFRNLSQRTVSALHALLHLDLAGPDATPVLASSGALTWFHLAADAYVPASLSQPSTVVQTNITSTLHVLEAARAAGPRHLLVTSSSEVYGSHPGPIAEGDPLEPATPYAASKVACDRLARSYHDAFGLPLTIVRPFNCYGPRHVYDVVPLYLARALGGLPLVVNGDGTQTRDLTYVSDTVDAFLRLAELPPEGKPYNIGTGVDHGIADLARQVLAVTGCSVPVRPGPARPGEVRKLQADATALREATGWEPRHSLAEGLRLNLEWIRDEPGWL